MSLPEEFVNRFICGNCFERIPAEVPDESIDLILTDPPYGIDYRSNRRVARPKFEKFDNDIDLSWVEGWVQQMYRVLKDNTHFYCFTRFDMYPVFFSEISKLFKVKNCLIWVKNNHGSGDLNGSFAPQNEMIIFAAKGNRHLNGPRDSDVLDKYDNVASARRIHPTEKPIELLRMLIEKSTEPDEIVMDPFGGSGSTAMACISTHFERSDGYRRKYLLYEINNEYRERAVQTILGAQGVLIDAKPESRTGHAKQRPAMRARRYRTKGTESLQLPFPQ